MSKIVDERVVEMRFDNAQFEKNVATSISTLDKLKAKLNLKDSSKGLEEVGRAANRVRFDGMIDGINTVNARFSYLQGTIQHQLNNIVDSCVTAGKRMVSALTIRPVKDGLQEYELQINAVQTIMANTGDDVKTVNNALDELNDYADLTIYNFSQMTQNAGTFTAALGKGSLDKAMISIKGIGNWAAYAGANANDMARATFQLGQALAQGSVRLQDWMSIEHTSGMAGQNFQNAFKETAKSVGIDVDALIEKNGSFRESLREGWLTTDIFMETMERFANDDAMTKAATQVKTFTQLVGTIQEALGTGWAETWRIVIGDFEEARTLWTSVNDAITPFINKMADARNTLLNSALGKGFDELSAKIKSCVSPAVEAVDTVKKVGTAISDLGTIVDDVILGKFGNGADRFNALSDAGINYYEVQNKVNEKLNCSKRYTDEQIREQNKLLGITADSTEATENQADATVSLTEDQKNNLKALMKLNTEQLKAKGLTEEQIAALDELRTMSKKLGVPIDEFIDKLDQINGRWLLLEGFKNIGRAIAKVFSSISEAASEVFRAITPDDIFNLLAAFHKLTASLILTDENADKLKRTFKGLFAAIDTVRTILGGGFSIAIKLVSALLGNANMSVLDFTARMGDAIVKLHDFLFNNELVNKGVDLLAKGFEKVGEVVGKIIDLLVHNPVTEKITSIWDGIFGSANKGENSGTLATIKQIGDTLDLSGDKANNFKSIMEGVKNSLSIGNWQWTATLSSNIKLVNSVLSLFGTNMADVIAKVADAITWFGNWSNMHLMFVNSGAKLSEVLATIITGIQGCVDAFMELEPVQAIIKHIHALLSIFFGDMSKGIDSINITNFTKQLANTFSKIEEWIRSLKKSEHLGQDLIRGIVKGLTSGVSAVASAIMNIVTTIMNIFTGKFEIHSPSKWFIRMTAYCIEGIVIGFKEGLSKVRSAVSGIASEIKNGFSEFSLSKLWVLIVENTKLELPNISSAAIWGDLKNTLDGMQKYLSKFCDFLKTIRLKDLLTLIPIGVVLITGKKLFEAAKVLATGIKSINGVIDAAAGALKSLSGLAKAYEKQVKAKAFRNIAISLGILVAAVVALTLVDQNKLFNAVATITWLAGVMVILSLAINKLDSASITIKKSEKSLSGVKSGLLAIGGAILMLAASVKLMGSMDSNEFDQGLRGLTVAVVGMLALVAAISLLGDTKFTNLKSVADVGKMMVAMSAALLITSIAVKKIAKLPDEDLARAYLFIGNLGLFAMAFIAVSSIAGENASKAGTMLIKMAVALTLMVSVVKLIGMLKVTEMAKGALFMYGFMGFVGILVAITTAYPPDGVKGLGRLVMSISFSLMLLVGVCKLVNKLSVSEMVKAGGFMLAFLGFLKLLVTVTKIGKEEQIAKVSATILAMSVAVGALAAVSILMGLVDTKMLIKGAGAVSALGLIMTAMIWATRGAKDCKANLTVMVVAITAMCAAVVGLSMIDTKKLLGTTAAMVSLMAAFALMESSIRKSKGAWKNLLILTAIVGALSSVLWAMSKLGVNNALQNAGGLSILLASMAVSLRILDGVKDISMNALESLVVLTGVVLLIGSVLGALDALNVSTSLETVASISAMLLAMSAVTVILSKFNIDAGSALKGVEALIVVLTGVSLILSALAALDKFSSGKASELINNGIPMLASIGQAIGEFVGSIAAGFGSAIIDLIPQIGTALSEFMNNMSGFITGISSIGPEALSGAGYLAGAIVALGFSEWFAALSTLCAGNMTLPKLGSDLSDFATNAAEFLDAIAGVSPESAQAAENMGKAILAISKAEIISSLGSFDKLLGESNTEKLGQELVAFGKAMADFSQAVDGKINPTAIEAAKNAGEMMVELQKSLPRSGGLLQDILGEADIAEFGHKCCAFGLSMVSFGSVIEGSGGIKTEAIQQARDAGVLMSELQNSLPKTGGVLQDIVGEQDLTEFGHKCCAFGLSMISFGTVIESAGGIKTEAIQQARDAGVLMNELAKAIPKSGGALQDLLGAQDLAKFGEQCAAFGQAITEFSNNTSADPEVANKAKAAGETMAALQKAIPEKNFFDGKVTLDKFGKKITEFGKGLSEFAFNIAGIDFEGSTKPALACANSLILLANNVQNVKMDGIEEFKKVATIGDVIKSFSYKVQDISIETVTTSVNAAKELQNFITGLIGLDYTGIEAFKVDEIGIAIKSYADHVAGIDPSAVIASASAADKLADTIRNLTGMDSSLASQFSEAINTLAQANIEGFVTALSTAGPRVSAAMTTIMTSLTVTVNAQSNNIQQAFNTMMTSVIAAITSRQSYFATAGSTMMLGMSVGVNSGSGGVISAVSSVITRIVSATNVKVSTFITTGRQITTNLRTGVMSGAPSLLSQITTIITNAKSKITSRGTEFMAAGISLMNSLSGGVYNGSSRVTPAITSALRSCSGAIRSYYYSFQSAGQYLGSGLVSGINSKQAAAYRAGYNLGKKAVAGEKAGQQSHSPSKATRKAGRWLGEGLVIGIKEMAASVYQAGKSMGTKASDSITEALTLVNDIATWGIDADPEITIHPVLDMSDINSGIGYIDGLLNTNKTIGLSTSGIATINTADVANQNGFNTDVIKAIDSIRKEIGSINGNTYNLNGITYDDGSNVADAIQTLVRAANIERRR